VAKFWTSHHTSVSLRQLAQINHNTLVNICIFNWQNAHKEELENHAVNKGSSEQLCDLYLRKGEYRLIVRVDVHCRSRI